MEKIVAAHSSPREYLFRERKAKDKHEYFEGDIIALAGASLAHNRIVANLMRSVGNVLAGLRCEILPSDIRITTPSATAYMYPDATIVCGPPEMADHKFDTITNPKVIFEVLSPSTADHDRKKKFFFYQQIPSFREYVLIDSTQYLIEVGTKQGEGWEFEGIEDPEGHLSLSSIKAQIPLVNIYRNVF
ncbi:MAG TPA: Uma2 family endonuclease [Puia sp.]|nr:Uma2 family endonuclease [Puia sp.]